MDSFDITATIARLFVHPIKSCAGIEVQEALLTDTGLDLDRAWMVVDADGVFVSQRELPRMALVRPQLRLSDMVLRAPGMLALHVSLDEVEQPLQVQVWGDIVQAFDMGKVAAQWFTDFLGRPLRLVRFDPDYRRVCSPKWTGDTEATTQFADGFPVLVATAAAVDDLNTRLTAAGFGAVGVERFRPNIVLAGIEAHDEDRVDMLHITTADGVVQLQPVKPCARCPIPDIDPATAESHPAVGNTLRSYRQDARVNGAITFGMNAIVREGAGQVLRVGQVVGANYQFD